MAMVIVTYQLPTFLPIPSLISFSPTASCPGMLAYLILQLLYIQLSPKHPNYISKI